MKKHPVPIAMGVAVLLLFLLHAAPQRLVHPLHLVCIANFHDHPPCTEWDGVFVFAHQMRWTA